MEENMSAPVPRPGTFLTSIRSSSRALCEAAGISVIILHASVCNNTVTAVFLTSRDIVYFGGLRQHCLAVVKPTKLPVPHISAESIKRLLDSPTFLTSFQRVSGHHGMALPLKFTNSAAELNFLSVLSLLNFGSGYRVPLHQQTGRGAWDNMRALVLSMYLVSAVGGDGDLLSAKGMHNITIHKVAELMNVTLHEEKAHPDIPGLTVGQLGGPIHELVTLITSVLSETGEILVHSGYRDLGSFVIEALTEGDKARSCNGDGVEVETILERLVTAFPAFRDMGKVDGQPVYCFKKALFLIHTVELRFGSLSPPPFPIPKTSKCPIFADNVIPSMLIHLGIIDLQHATLSLSTLFADANSAETLTPLLTVRSQLESNSAKVAPVDGPVLTDEQAFILRAAAIHACELIVEVARSTDFSLDGGQDVRWINELTLPQLDMWLWAVAKDRPDYRKLARFVSRQTFFF